MATIGRRQKTTASLSNTIKIEIFQDYSGDPTYVIDKGKLNFLQIHQSVSERIGTFMIKLVPSYYTNSFYRQVKGNALVNIYIDDEMRMQGILLRPKEAGQISKEGTTNRAVVLWGYDLGYLLRDVHKTLSAFSENYIATEAEAVKKLSSVFRDKRFVADQIKDMYRIVIDAISQMVGGKYLFGDGKFIYDRFGSSGEKLFWAAPNDDFYVNAPISIQLLQPEHNILDRVIQLADPVFSEVFGDTFGANSETALGSKVEKAGFDGYRMIVRPKMYKSNINDFWADNLYYVIDDEFYEYSVMKDATKIYNYFVVGNAGYDQDMNFAEATGKTAILEDSITTYGFKPFRTDIKSVWGTEAKKNEADVNALINNLSEFVLKEWYKNAEDHLSGQLSFPYFKEARVGRKVRFKLPKDKSLYEGYTEALDIIYSADAAKIHNVVTYIRGREL